MRAYGNVATEVDEGMAESFHMTLVATLVCVGSHIACGNRCAS